MRSGKMRTVQKFRRLYKNESGAFTLENALVFPVIFVLCVLMLFVGIYMYQKVVFVQQTSMAATHAAHHWPAGPNGYTAAPEEKNEQGLYWRTFDDSLSQLFGRQKSTEQATVQLPIADDLSHFSLAQRKLLSGSQQIATGVSGQLSFTHLGYTRFITATAVAPFRSLNLAYFTIPDRLSATAEASISEPVEFLRTWDLATGYIGNMLNRFGNEEVGNAFERFISLKAPNSFRYHDNHDEFGEGADTYLRKLVGGTKESRLLDNGTIRRIDALDAHGIAHQTYLSFSTSQLRSEQMVKDIELLNKGEVNGVVWHFFRKSKDGEGRRVGPPESFIKELEDNGILVVIHD